MFPGRTRYIFRSRGSDARTNRAGKSSQICSRPILHWGGTLGCSPDRTWQYVSARVLRMSMAFEARAPPSGRAWGSCHNSSRWASVADATEYEPRLVYTPGEVALVYRGRPPTFSIPLPRVKLTLRLWFTADQPPPSGYPPHNHRHRSPLQHPKGRTTPPSPSLHFLGHHSDSDGDSYSDFYTS